MSFKYEALVLFLALFALYSPVAALSSYLPIVRPFSHAQQLRLALGLAVNVTVFVLLAIWVGEPLLELLGISTAALTATGGIALILAAVPLMRGTGGVVPPAGASDMPASAVPPAGASDMPASAVPPASVAPPAGASGIPASAVPPAGASGMPASAVPNAGPAAVPSAAAPAVPPAAAAAPDVPATPSAASATSSPAPTTTHLSDFSDTRQTDPRSVLFTPLTFPLTVGGTTFAFGVAASADAGSVAGRLWLSVAAVAYALVTGITLYLSGHVERRISPAVAAILDRVAGILLTSIAVVLLANGFTDLVRAAWNSG